MKSYTNYLFLALITLWYLITFFVPYNTLSDFLGRVNLGNGRSWPLTFFLLDGLVLAVTVLFIKIYIHFKNKYLSFLLGILLIYPLFTVWATLQDIVFNPIKP